MMPLDMALSSRRGGPPHSAGQNQPQANPTEDVPPVATTVSSSSSAPMPEASKVQSHAVATRSLEMAGLMLTDSLAGVLGSGSSGAGGKMAEIEKAMVGLNMVRIFFFLMSSQSCL